VQRPAPWRLDRGGAIPPRSDNRTCTTTHRPLRVAGVARWRSSSGSPPWDWRSPQGLRRSASPHATSVICSCALPSLSTQPLTIWMRSRLAPSASFSAATGKVGPLAPSGGFGRSVPMGTPSAEPASATSPLRASFGSKPQPPKKRTVMRVPDVPSVRRAAARRCGSEKSPGSGARAASDSARSSAPRATACRPAGRRRTRGERPP